MTISIFYQLHALLITILCETILCMHIMDACQLSAVMVRVYVCTCIVTTAVHAFCKVSIVHGIGIDLEVTNLRLPMWALPVFFQR